MSTRAVARLAVSALVAGGAVSVMTPAAHAATTFTWVGGTGRPNWSSGGNWQGGNPPNGTGLTIDFPAGASSFASLDDLDGIGVSTLQFDAGGYTLSGNELSPTTIQVASSSPTTITNNLLVPNLLSVVTGDGAPVELDGSISGAGGVLAAGSSSVILGGTSPNTNTGTDGVTGSATLVLKKPDGIPVTAGNVEANDFSGANYVLWEGSNQIDNPTREIGVAGNELELFNHDDTVGTVSLNSGVVSTGTGTLTVAKDLINNNTAGTISGNLHLTSDTHNVDEANSDNNLTVAAALTGDGPIIKNGGGTLTLDDACSYTGPLTVTGGVVSAPNGYGGAVTTDGGSFSGGECSGTPVNSTPPAVTGTPQVGQTLTTDSGTWTNNPTSFSVQWLRCTAQDVETCVPIDSATARTYTVSSDDVGDYLAAEVAASNGGESRGYALSNFVGPVTAATSAPPVPTVAGIQLLPSVAADGTPQLAATWSDVTDDAGARVCVTAGTAAATTADCSNAVDVSAPTTSSAPVAVGSGDYTVTVFGYDDSNPRQYGNGVSATGIGTTETIAGPRAATYGDTVRMSTVLHDSSGAAVTDQPVELWARHAGSSRWSRAVTAATDDTGHATALVHPRTSIDYQWRFQGSTDDRLLASASAVRHLPVAQLVTAHVQRQQTHLQVYGVLRPATSGAVATLQVYRHHRWVDTSHTATVHRQQMPRGRETVGYVMAFDLPVGVHDRVRVVVPATDSNTAGRSRTVTT